MQGVNDQGVVRMSSLPLIDRDQLAHVRPLARGRFSALDAVLPMRIVRCVIVVPLDRLGVANLSRVGFVPFEARRLNSYKTVLVEIAEAVSFPTSLNLNLNMAQAAPVDYGDLQFTRPADKIKAVNAPDVPQEIFTGMKIYEDAARGMC